MSRRANRWEAWCASESEWNAALSHSADATPFGSWGWGEYRRSAGWLPLRLCAFGGSGGASSPIIAMAQVLVRALPGRRRVLWLPGGPSLCFSDTPARETGALLGELFERLAPHPRRAAFVRCDHYGLTAFADSQRGSKYLPKYLEGEEARLAFAFRQRCARPWHPINGGFSRAHDLRLSPADLRAAMSAKHRHTLGRALKAPLRWQATLGSSPEMPRAVESLWRLNQHMVSGKSLSTLGADRADLERLCAAMGENVTLFSGLGENGQAITSCLVLTLGARLVQDGSLSTLGASTRGGRAFYLAAATGEEGRRSNGPYASAAYGLVWHLWEHLRERGVHFFDFGGVDPRSGAAVGVNHFKNGWGGRLCQYVGEWEWSNSPSLRAGVNALLFWRERPLRIEQRAHAVRLARTFSSL